MVEQQTDRAFLLGISGEVLFNLSGPLKLHNKVSDTTAPSEDYAHLAWLRPFPRKFGLSFTCIKYIIR